MYTQTLIKVLPDYIKPKILKRNNRYNKWEYGYNEEYDFIVISKTGKIGEVYEIQNLKIALPEPEYIHKRSKKKEEQFWEVSELNKDLKRIKTIFDWKDYPIEFKEKWYSYIDEEFKRRDEGFWFYNKGNPT